MREYPKRLLQFLVADSDGEIENSERTAKLCEKSIGLSTSFYQTPFSFMKMFDMTDLIRFFILECRFHTSIHRIKNPL